MFNNFSERRTLWISAIFLVSGIICLLSSIENISERAEWERETEWKIKEAHSYRDKEIFLFAQPKRFQDSVIRMIESALQEDTAEYHMRIQDWKKDLAQMATILLDIQKNSSVQFLKRTGNISKWEHIPSGYAIWVN
jgi:hypothetical protein